MSELASDPSTVYRFPPEPHLTPAEIVARAKAIAPKLVGRQAETEQRTFYAQDTHEQFAKAGFYRILVPRRYGGYEFGIETFLRVAMELTRACPSTGWMYQFGAAPALAVGTLFPEETQAEVFAGGDFICPATVAPSGTAERFADGCWKLNGTWTYASGSPYATHFMGHTKIPHGDGEPEPLLFIIPRNQWRRLDDWGEQLGLRGSGSHGVNIDNARIPAHYTLPAHLTQLSIVDGTPGRLLHRNPMYGGGPLSFLLLQFGSLAVGMARGALDAYEDLMRSRTTIYAPIVSRTEDIDFQFRFGEAAGMISAAEAALLNAIQQWSDLAAHGSAAFTREQEWRIGTMSREVVRLCWGAVEGQLFPTAGSSSIRQGERIERVWRDMSMLHSHAGYAIVLRTVANRELARARFSVE